MNGTHQKAAIKNHYGISDTTKSTQVLVHLASNPVLKIRNTKGMSTRIRIRNRMQKEFR